MQRRRLLQALGTAAATGGIAGCIGGPDGGTSPTETGPPTERPGRSPTDSQTASATPVAIASPTESPTPTRRTDEASMETVDLVSTTFDPVRLSVEPGTTVEWVNRDAYGHDVTAAQFDGVAADWSFSESVSGGGSTTYTFEEAGVYEYYCTIHGDAQMCGVVLVGDATLDQDLPCEADGGGGDDGYY